MLFDIETLLDNTCTLPAKAARWETDYMADPHLL